MLEFRVTKYDPAHRDSSGVYRCSDWTSISDMGRSFDGLILTTAGYRRVEDAYVAAATAFLEEAGVLSLVVSGLESQGGARPPVANGSVLNLAAAGAVIRRVLREEMWCRLEAQGGFIHFGYDYYMYVGVSHECPKSLATARRLGLFVEPWRSQHHT